MKFTLSWLKDHLDTQATLAEIVDTLTRVGLEVESVEDPGVKYDGFVVGHVVEARQHPNADRLKVCIVEAGAGPVQVVCGAPNARTGMRSVFSPVGTYIPGKKMTLAKGVIRGVESNGMLCSAAELELSNDHDGIMELPDDAPVGVPYARWAGLDDPVIDVALTPNRPDATGVSGIARDLAAAGLGTLKTPAPRPIEGEFDCPTGVRLDFAPADAHLCPAFALRLVRGVRNGPSPEWMQKRLRAIGLRPISALVDITNYVTFDRGRPLHVFDFAKVEGDLVVRRALNGESVLALDGKTYALDESMVVIADNKGAESIAGVMGGARTGCDESTRDVLIESALWDPANIAQTGRKLGIVTDARYRFERGVDPDFCVPGCDLATELVIQLCGGEPSRMIVAGDPSAPPRSIPFPYSEVKRLIGVEIPREEGEAILRRLGFGVEDGKVQAPSWRPDVLVKADVVEQILRIAGIDRAPVTPLPRLDDGVPAPVLTPQQKRTRLARRTLAALSLREAVTWSFISKRAAELFGGGQPSLALANPIAADLSDMRPSLVPGLVAASERNARRALSDVALFEVGQIFLGAGENDQRVAAAAAAAGPREGGRRGPTLERRRGRRRLRRQERRDDAPRCARRRQRGPDRPRRSRLSASRPIGDAADRAEERDRLVRAIASDRLRGARRRGADRRLRSHSRRCSRAEGEADPREAQARALRFHAGRTRSRLRRGRERARRRYRKGRARRRAAAGRRRRGVRRLSGQGAARGRQIRRHQRDAPAARAYADRRRDRRRDRQNRGGSVEEDRSHITRVTRCAP